MARHESDREDIMREAIALVERAEFHLAGESEPVIFGLRREGASSLFFGQDPVFHFNSRNELRRAYVGGDLIKAEQGRAIRLRRVRTQSEVQLQRSALTPVEGNALIDLLQSRLVALRTGIDMGGLQVVAVHPPEADMIDRLQTWLATLPERIVLADRPNVQ